MTNAKYQAKRLSQSPDSLLGQLNRIITEYSDREGTEPHRAIRDVLTDVRHLCDIRKFDFSALDRDGYEVYLQELGGVR